MFMYMSDLWNVLSSITYGYEGEKYEDTGWDWVRDPVIEYIDKNNEKNIRKEIESINNRGDGIRVRNIIRAICQSALCKESHKTRVLIQNVYLTPDMLSSIVRQVINEKGEKWKDCISRSFNIDIKWESSQYEKNLYGQMISLASCASNTCTSNGLTERELCDIVWSIFLSLKATISIELCRRLTKKEMIMISHIVCECVPSYLNLYIQTVENVKNTIDKQGILPKKWQKEKQLNDIKIKTMKENREIEHSYLEGPSINFTTIHLTKFEMNRRRNVIEKMLNSKSRKNKSIVEHVEVKDFESNKEKIERFFCTKMINTR